MVHNPGGDWHPGWGGSSKVYIEYKNTQQKQPHFLFNHKHLTKRGSELAPAVPFATLVHLGKGKHTNHRTHGTGRFTYIYHRNELNVGKYTIHGSNGIKKFQSNIEFFFLMRFVGFCLVERRNVSKVFEILSG